MINFTSACEIAFEKLSKIEVVFKLDNTSKKDLKLPASLEVWEVITEILEDNKCVEIKLHILLLPDFPYVFPKILLSPSDFEKFKYVPHIDNERVICTFDTEISRPEPNLPGEVIIQTIRKAKQVLEDGINKRNFEDFENEFLSYWEQQYDGENKVNKKILSLLEIPIKKPINILKLEKQLKGFYYIIHQNDEIASRFKLFLDNYKFKYQESEVLLLEDIKIKNKPPFAYKNSDILEVLKNQEELLKEFKTYINSNIQPKLILINQNNVPVLIGWFHKPFVTNRKGFRTGKISNFKALSFFQKNDFVNRVLPEVYTLNRLKKRSDGTESVAKSELCLGIAGTGSIGSNLIYFLNTLSKPEFRFIDTDDLKIENTGRYLLGFEFTGLKKTKGLKDFLLLQTPIQKITTRDKSIISVCQNEPEYINQMDFLFVCIGKTNIDTWIGEAIECGLIKIPVFFIWVEPYLTGGHCLYIYPGSKSYKSYFDDESLFQFNVISDNDYKNNNPLLTLKEASCQTSYVPYSSFSIVSFLSSLFPIISDLINKKKDASKSFTWVGNIQQLSEMGISLSENMCKNDEGKIFENKI